MMKIYNSILIILVAFLVSLSASIMLWSQPITGDLTRISAYPERWFGWNDAQQNITPLINSKRTSGKRHILVIGDSFSEAGHWQAYLGEKYSFTFIHNSKTTLPRILKLIQKDSPDAIILESAERALPDLYNKGSTFLSVAETCSLPESSQQFVHYDPQEKISALPVFPNMAREVWPRTGENISEGYHALKIWLKALIRPEKRKAKPLDLTRNDLFSNTRSNQILAFSKDFLLYDTADETSIKTMRCSMQAAANALTQANIPYVMLAIPDKSTAYQPLLANDDIRQRPALINRLHIDEINHGINMLPFIQNMAATGHKDIYLPNDTHWGYKGFQLAAVLVDTELAGQWPHD
jgi:hypothetical protein